MKKVIIISAIFLIMNAESRGQRQAINNNLITIDVTKNYSSGKELILQDFMDVEYIVLETNNDFLNQGFVQAIGKEIILVRNRIPDGDVFIYNKAGKGIRKFNRRGQGPEEYTNIHGITLDEDNGEMFVNDFMASKIVVYDLFGKYKRSFRHKEGVRYLNVYNFDKDKLICFENSFDINNEPKNRQQFTVISKKDGSIINEIQIPFEKKKSTVVRNTAIGSGFNATSQYPIIHYRDQLFITELSSDTVFRILPDLSLIPFIVRTPSIQVMREPEIFLFPTILTDRYYFMQTVKKEFNFVTNEGFPIKDFAYDSQDKTIFVYAVYNGDYSVKKTVKMIPNTINQEIAFFQTIEAFELVESNKKGELKGKLKEVASRLDEEDNPVIMLVKNKK